MLTGSDNWGCSEISGRYLASRERMEVELNLASENLYSLRFGDAGGFSATCKKSTLLSLWEVLGSAVSLLTKLGPSASIGGKMTECCLLMDTRLMDLLDEGLAEVFSCRASLQL